MTQGPTRCDPCTRVQHGVLTETRFTTGSTRDVWDPPPLSPLPLLGGPHPDPGPHPPSSPSPVVCGGSSRDPSRDLCTPRTLVPSWCLLRTDPTLSGVRYCHTPCVSSQTPPVSAALQDLPNRLSDNRSDSFDLFRKTPPSASTSRGPTLGVPANTPTVTSNHPGRGEGLRVAPVLSTDTQTLSDDSDTPGVSSTPTPTRHCRGSTVH